MTRERTVRDTLPTRPAGIVEALPRETRSVLLGLWACGRSEGSVGPRGLFLGKSEAERNWPEAHQELRDAGLIDFRTEERTTPGAVAGSTTYMIWNMTPKGAAAMKDMQDWRNEMQDARDADATDLAISAAENLSAHATKP